ncbi:hypothetical protein CGRA01v4_12934 [Colletotrichum graminicola]|nr:hypothetical protein CGRA01v4_12934 [Colletotrichum graminicola]
MYLNSGVVAEIVKVVAPPTKKNAHTRLLGSIFGATLAQFVGSIDRSTKSSMVETLKLVDICKGVLNNLVENTNFMYHILSEWASNQALAQDDYFAVNNPGVDPRKIPSIPMTVPNLTNTAPVGRFGTMEKTHMDLPEPTSNLPVCEFNFDYNPYEEIW